MRDELGVDHEGLAHVADGDPFDSDNEEEEEDDEDDEEDEDEEDE